MDSINETEKPNKKNFYNEKMKNYTIKNKSWLHRYKLKKQGKKDARRGVIRFSEKGEVISPFTTELTQIANKKLETIWNNCTYDLSDIRAFLDSKQERFDSLIIELPKLKIKQNEIIFSIKEEKRLCDENMDETTVENRKRKRIADQTENINDLIANDTEEINQIIKDCKQAITDMEKREEIADTHEETVKHDLKEDISIYMQGTWKTVDTERFDVIPPETTTKPRERHFNLFGNYNFSINDRTKQLTSLNDNNNN